MVSGNRNRAAFVRDIFGREGLCRRRPRGRTNPLVETGAGGPYGYCRRGGFIVPSDQHQTQMSGRGTSQFLCRAPGIPTGFCLKAQGLRGTSHPGLPSQNIFNRKAVAPLPFRCARDFGHNAVGVASISEPTPKVAPTNRGNLGLKDTIPLGLSNQATSQKLRCARAAETGKILSFACVTGILPRNKFVKIRALAGTAQLKTGSAPAPGAADDDLVVSIGIGTNALIGLSFREEFVARARRTTAGAAVLPINQPHRSGLGVEAKYL